MDSKEPLESTLEPSSASAPAPTPPVFRSGTHKSCDSCKRRKVKCPNTNYPSPCSNCVRRGTTCHFGIKKVPKRDISKHLRSIGHRVMVLDRTETPSNSPQSSISTPSASQIGAVVIPKLYIDHLLGRVQEQTRSQKAASFVKGNGVFGICGGDSLTFFSEGRLLSLSTRLKNNKVNDLVRRINAFISGRLRRNEHAEGQTPSMLPPSSSGNSGSSSSTGGNANNPALQISSSLASAYIQSYFEQAHVLYPFLDRAAFKSRTTDTDTLASSLASSKAWSALYHSVLAIGCLYAGRDDDGGGGSFELGKGAAWRIFSVALAQFSELMTMPDSLLLLQALTAMAVYGLGVACLSIEQIILFEATRRAQSMAAAGYGNGAILANGGYSLTAASATATFQRTFWLLYGIDKVTSFHLGRSSTFIDGDISCPYPAGMASLVYNDDHLEWFIFCVQHARLLSRTYTSLLSIGNIYNSPSFSLATIEQLRVEAEEWRRSIPETGGMRPCLATAGGLRKRRKLQFGAGNGGTSSGSLIRNAGTPKGIVILSINYMYYGFILILSRAELHHLSRLPLPLSTQQQEQQSLTEKEIMASARAILELTPFIDMEPYTPLWTLAVIPLMALLTLFDHVIHSPGSSEVTSNLALLDMAAGYFSRIEYSSDGSLPGSLVSEFAHIARDYINDYQRGQSSAAAAVKNGSIQQPTPSQALFSPTPQPHFPTPSPTAITDSMEETIESAACIATPQTGNSTAGDLQGAGDIPTGEISPVLGDPTLGGINYNSSDGYGLGDSSDMSGTDVMGLFSYILPEMDSMMFQGIMNG